MGMFDYVECEVPLPGGYRREGYDFQTKDYKCRLLGLRITTGGLVAEEIDEQAEAMAVASGEPCDPDNLCRPVVDVKVPFHGDLWFYDENSSFVARFWKGELRFVVDASGMNTWSRSFVDALGTVGMGDADD